ncbi:MAG: hypothetical protein FWH49_03945 [Clostridiales bacterium]|nr:hypothetical protein [Clostridiales bacterium]
MRWIGVVLSLILLTGMAACGSNAQQPSSDGDAQAQAPPAGLDEQPNLVDQGDSVAITFPEEMFRDVTLSEEFVEFNNYIDAYTNSDGRVTVVMSKERQAEFLDAFQGDVEYNITYFIAELEYLKDITYSEDLRYMDLYVDGKTDTEELKIAPYFFSGLFEQYQLMLGQEIWMTMRVIDADTHETILNLEFPDSWN